jgi:ribosomal protein L37AE/L43A
MKNLTIDPEYKDLLPKQTAEERAALTESILADGCRDAIIIDENDVIIDGHNRYEICTEHGIEFQTVVKRFESREDAVIFICKNQYGRRNLSQEQRAYILGKQYEAEKKLSRGGGDRKSEIAKNQSHQNDDFEKAGKTKFKLAKEMNVGSTTVERSGNFASGVDVLSKVAPEVKETILSGKSGVTMGAVAQMTKLHEDEIKEAAQKIKEGRGKEVVQMMKEKEAEKKATKTCSRCKRALPLERFSEGRNVCKECHNETQEWSKYIGVSENASEGRREREMTQKVCDEVRNLDRTFTYDANDVAMELTAIAETFARQTRYILQNHADLVKSAPSITIAALSEAEAAIKETKEICS